MAATQVEQQPALDAVQQVADSEGPAPGAPASAEDAAAAAMTAATAAASTTAPSSVYATPMQTPSQTPVEDADAAAPPGNTSQLVSAAGLSASTTTPLAPPLAVVTPETMTAAATPVANAPLTATLPARSNRGSASATVLNIPLASTTPMSPLPPRTANAASNLLSLPQNGARREITDLYKIFRSLEKRGQIAIEADAPAFGAWWADFAGYQRVFFNYEATLLLPWLRSAAMGGEVVEDIRAKALDVRESWDRLVLDVHEYVTDPVVVKYEKMRKAADVYVAHQDSLFSEQEKTLIPVIEQNFSPRQVAKMEKVLVKICVSTSKLNPVILCRWMDDPLRYREWVQDNFTGMDRFSYTTWHKLFMNTHHIALLEFHIKSGDATDLEKEYYMSQSPKPTNSEADINGPMSANLGSRRLSLSKASRTSGNISGRSGLLGGILRRRSISTEADPAVSGALSGSSFQATAGSLVRASDVKYSTEEEIKKDWTAGSPFWMDDGQAPVPYKKQEARETEQSSRAAVAAAAVTAASGAILTAQSASPAEAGAKGESPRHATENTQEEGESTPTALTGQHDDDRSDELVDDHVEPVSVAERDIAEAIEPVHEDTVDTGFDAPGGLDTADEPESLENPYMTSELDADSPVSSSGRAIETTEAALMANNGENSIAPVEISTFAGDNVQEPISAASTVTGQEVQARVQSIENRLHETETESESRLREIAENEARMFVFAEGERVERQDNQVEADSRELVASPPVKDDYEDLPEGVAGEPSGEEGDRSSPLVVGAPVVAVTEDVHKEEGEDGLMAPYVAEQSSGAQEIDLDDQTPSVVDIPVQSLTADIVPEEQKVVVTSSAEEGSESAVDDAVIAELGPVAPPAPRPFANMQAPRTAPQILSKVEEPAAQPTPTLIVPVIAPAPTDEDMARNLRTSLDSSRASRSSLKSGRFAGLLSRGKQGRGSMDSAEQTIDQPKKKLFGRQPKVASVAPSAAETSQSQSVAASEVRPSSLTYSNPSEIKTNWTPAAGFFMDDVVAPDIPQPRSVAPKPVTAFIGEGRPSAAPEAAVVAIPPTDSASPIGMANAPSIEDASEQVHSGYEKESSNRGSLRLSALLGGRKEADSPQKIDQSVESKKLGIFKRRSRPQDQDATVDKTVSGPADSHTFQASSQVTSADVTYSSTEEVKKNWTGASGFFMDDVVAPDIPRPIIEESSLRSTSNVGREPHQHNVPNVVQSVTEAVSTEHMNDSTAAEFNSEEPDEVGAADDARKRLSGLGAMFRRKPTAQSGREGTSVVDGLPQEANFEMPPATAADTVGQFRRNSLDAQSGRLTGGDASNSRNTAATAVAESMGVFGHGMGPDEAFGESPKPGIFRRRSIERNSETKPSNSLAGIFRRKSLSGTDPAQESYQAELPAQAGTSGTDELPAEVPPPRDDDFETSRDTPSKKGVFSIMRRRSVESDTIPQDGTAVDDEKRVPGFFRRRSVEARRSETDDEKENPGLVQEPTKGSLGKLFRRRSAEYDAVVQDDIEIEAPAAVAVEDSGLEHRVDSPHVQPRRGLFSLRKSTTSLVDPGLPIVESEADEISTPTQTLRTSILGSLLNRRGHEQPSGPSASPKTGGFLSRRRVRGGDEANSPSIGASGDDSSRLRSSRGLGNGSGPRFRPGRRTAKASGII